VLVNKKGVMMDKQQVIEALRDKIGAVGRQVTIEVDKSLIRKFAEAVGDPNPLWHDDEYAIRSRHGSMVAPPSLVCSVMFSGGDARPELPLPYDRKLDAKGEWEFFLPIRAGDVITSKTKFIKLEERQGKSGAMLFLTFETSHENQRGKLVAKSWTTIVNLE